MEKISENLLRPPQQYPFLFVKETGIVVPMK